MTRAIEVIPVPPGVWSEPSATATPLSSRSRTGGRALVCKAVPGQTTAATLAWASAATSSSVASCSRSAEAQPISAASRAAPVRESPQACRRGSRPERRPALRIQRASSSENRPSSQYTSTLSAPTAEASAHQELTASI